MERDVSNVYVFTVSNNCVGRSCNDKKILSLCFFTWRKQSKMFLRVCEIAKVMSFWNYYWVGNSVHNLSGREVEHSFDIYGHHFSDRTEKNTIIIMNISKIRRTISLVFFFFSLLIGILLFPFSSIFKSIPHNQILPWPYHRKTICVLILLYSILRKKKQEKLETILILERNCQSLLRKNTFSSHSVDIQSLLRKNTFN